MHKDKRAAKIVGRGPGNKAIVAAVLERGGKVRAKVIGTRKKGDLQKLVRENVEVGSSVYSDALKSYDGLANDFTNQVIDHAQAYVNGPVHTNGMENFWSLKPFHLFRYVDEQAFRFNSRNGMKDGDRFSLAVSQIVGKRLTWNQVIGKEGELRRGEG